MTLELRIQEVLFFGRKKADNGSSERKEGHIKKNSPCKLACSTQLLCDMIFFYMKMSLVPEAAY